MISRPAAVRPGEGYPGVYDLHRGIFSRDDEVALEGLHRAAIYPPAFEPGSGDPEE
ncbi:hypothetical protein [Methanoculleus sp. 10]|jgi:hypothetical protein|uniref:hypothetical protein n=1 Tax=Methanoculleus sp. 10 TaxID=430615 RepID=UPI001B4D3327|nr:hypothetical protein [Methanoculleus sp. 10]MBP7410822.1 hypothetical protein [Methanoculleus sp.]